MPSQKCFCYLVKRLMQPLSRNRLIGNLRDSNFFEIFFYLYIYPPDSQESDEEAIHRVNNYPNLLPEMPRYCCPLVI